MIDRARLQAVSREIVGQLASPREPLAETWAKNLAGLAQALQQSVEREKNSPTPAALKVQLRQITQAIDVIDRAFGLGDQSRKVRVQSAESQILLEMLNTKMTEGVAQIGPMMLSLRRVRKAANAVIPNIETKRGPGKMKVAGNLLGPLAQYALLIRETWRAAKGETPGDTNPAAWQMAGDLWRAATDLEPPSERGWEAPFARARACKREDWQLLFVQHHLQLQEPDYTMARTEADAPLPVGDPLPVSLRKTD